MTGAGARRAASEVAQGLAWGVLLAVSAALVLTLALPHAFGWRAYTVMSGSMEPAIAVGDVVVNRQVRPRDVRPDRVITFREPRRDRLITHRLLHAEARGGTVELVTRGDANSSAERFTVSADGSLGEAVYRLPRLGHVLVLLRTFPGVLVLVVPILLAAALVAWRVIAAPPPRRSIRQRAAILMRADRSRLS
jgi:signal peptidase